MKLKPEARLLTTGYRLLTTGYGLRGAGEEAWKQGMVNVYGLRHAWTGRSIGARRTHNRTSTATAGEDHPR